MWICKNINGCSAFLGGIAFFFLTLDSVESDGAPVEEMNAQDFMGNYTKYGYTAAFGDINSDKQTDVYVISENGKEVLIFLGSSVSPALNWKQTVQLDDVATSVVSTDFNGDDISDLLVTYRKDENKYLFSIYWGIEHGKIRPDGSYKSTELLYDEPLLLDANADMIADLFVVYMNQTRRFLVGQEMEADWNFAVKEFKTKEGESLLDVYSPHSHAFIDLTGEGSADLFVTSHDKEKKPVFEIWKGSSTGLLLEKRINTSEIFKEQQMLISPVSFGDFNADCTQDILLATCVPEYERCKSGQILIYSKGQWYPLFTSGDAWSFPNTDGKLSHTQNTLHIADFNLDSFPDVLLILQDRDTIRRPVILYNQPCSSESCANFGRQLDLSVELPNADGAESAAFYDFSMDGTMDVIVTTKSDEGYQMKAYKNMIADDVTFLRVQVLSGHTDTALYGVNIPGPQVKYETTNPMGGAVCGALGQLSQSAHMSLQLPYVIFGLGRLANFVDSLTVSIPVPLIVDLTSPVVTAADSSKVNDTFSPKNSTWPMLIPNSQMYVIPYPQNEPSRWKNKLLVTPSRNVVTTAIVLLSSCGVLTIATLILHWMEKREDKQEKIQQAYRFHFDAM